MPGGPVSGADVRSAITFHRSGGTAGSRRGVEPSPSREGARPRPRV
ncbi:hypothetical protein ATKI12_7770 [Kitasatospora sp. Ki12]